MSSPSGAEPETMAKGFFITGTDTGVGKTVISTAVVRLLHCSGITAGAMKPVETGCEKAGDLLIPHDATLLKRAARMDEPASLVAPCCYESPLSPLAASEADDCKLPDIAKIMAAFWELSAAYEVMVVEGAGGLMVPIRRDYSMTDLAAELGLALIVVSRPGLGALNHTLLTIGHAADRGLKVAGIVINYSRPPENSLAEKTNPGLLARLTPVPVIGIFPYLEDIHEEIIEQEALKRLALDEIRNYCGH